jgi:Tfp pilus assembly protein PilF
MSVTVFAAVARAQPDDICREFGETPTRELGRDNRPAPYVFGRIVIKGVPPGAKPPRVIAIYSDTQQPAMRQVIGKSGNYCFQKRGNAGTLVIDVDGMEMARKTVSDIAGTRQREDFEIYPLGQGTREAPPGVINARFGRPPNDKTADLYRKAGEAEQANDTAKVIEHIKEIVAVDPADFIAWAKLGSLYLQTNALADAEAAFRRALEIRGDYTPALINLGVVAAMQGYYPAAVAIFQEAVKSDPKSARAYRFLGEAYLQNKQGSLGVAALDEALRLDPVGMAECHLLKARLYDLVGAKNLAAAEYKQFLEKVNDHPDRKKFEKYVKDNL